jgi:hypothetical protein
VRYTANCKPFTTNKCQVIHYQECYEEPTEDCKYKEKSIPWQKKIHKKKCLLPDNGSTYPEVILAVGNCDIHADPNILFINRGANVIKQYLCKLPW